MENIELLQRISKTYHKLRGKGGSRPAQERILHILEHHEKVTQQTLMDILELRQGTVSEMLGKLEKRGYIKKEQDPSDGRRYLYFLTEEGRRAEAERRDKSKAEDANLFDCLDEEEKEMLARILDKVLQS